MIPSCKMLTATHRKYGICDGYKRGPIPRLIWNDGHTEWSRWYWFKEEGEHIINGYYGFK